MELPFNAATEDFDSVCNNGSALTLLALSDVVLTIPVDLGSFYKKCGVNLMWLGVVEPI